MVCSQGARVIPSKHLLRNDEAIASALRKIWARVLDVERVEPDDDFYALGADSPAAVEQAVGVDNGRRPKTREENA
jgi:hypothetical protein